MKGTTRDQRERQCRGANSSFAPTTARASWRVAGSPTGLRARSCRSPMASPSTAAATRVSPPRSTPQATPFTPTIIAATGQGRAGADLGHFADEGGWDKVVGDLWTLNRRIAAEQPGAPIIFLGHSLGSFLGRSFIAEHSDALAGAALSGSSGKPPAIATLGPADRPRGAAAAGQARQERAHLPDVVRRLQQAVQARAHRLRLAVARREGGRRLRRRSAAAASRSRPSSRSTCSTRCPTSRAEQSLAPIRKDMPIYVFSGERDPVGANIQGLIGDLKAAGFTRLTTRIYPGRPARDAERDQPRRGDARPHRLARRGGRAQ